MCTFGTTTDDIYLNRHYPNIEFRRLNITTLVVGTCWETREEFVSEDSIFRKKQVAQWADILRLLLIYNYGGAWLDADCLPVLDLTILADEYYGKVVGGFSGNKKVKNAGVFNNNFFMATGMTARKSLLTQSCKFRKEPVYDKHGVMKKTKNMVPTIEPGVAIYVMNWWLFNDGLLRMCWIDKDCPMQVMTLKNFDPVWMKTNELYSFCEQVTLEFQYLDSMTSLVRHIANYGDEEGLRKYVLSTPLDKHVWTIHTRAQQCRSLRGRPSGIYERILSATEWKLSQSPEPPVHAATFLANDKYEEFQSAANLIFIKHAILIKSNPSNTELRNIMRQSYASKNWTFGKHENPRSVWKLFFVVPYGKQKKLHAKLLMELMNYDDLLLVDENAFDYFSWYTGKVSAPMARGILKYLNVHESHFFTLVNDDTLCIHVKGVFDMLQEAVGEGYYINNKQMPTQLITDDITEKEVLVGNAHSLPFDMTRRPTAASERLPIPQEHHKAFTGASPLESLYAEETLNIAINSKRLPALTVEAYDRQVMTANELTYTENKHMLITRGTTVEESRYKSRESVEKGHLTTLRTAKLTFVTDVTCAEVSDAFT
eukprot:GHVO01028348.1.p1 GENE.GHVO01028348.1~~GHVO01028348.1.p1  ORF type:complete len:599 (-),score=57.04 GHVO01028348.1:147-1943(-)